MIVQSDGNKSVVLLDADLSEYPVIRLSLHAEDRLLQAWTKNDMTFDVVDAGYAISVAWTQLQTAELVPGRVIWSLKAFDPDGNLVFGDEDTDIVLKRTDRTPIVMVEGE